MDSSSIPPQVLKIKKIPRQRHFLAVFFISFAWGVFGIDRMYLGKWGTGLLKLVTAGGAGLWQAVDLWLIMSGAMRDAQGREMAEFTEYKTLAYKTTVIAGVVVVALAIISGALLVNTAMDLITNLQNGTFPGIQGLDPLNDPEIMGY